MKGIGALAVMFIIFIGVVIFVAMITEDVLTPRKYKYKKVTYAGGRVRYYTYYKKFLFWKRYWYESYGTEEEARDVLERRKARDLENKANRRVKSEEDNIV